jgi:hypothetical protein
MERYLGLAFTLEVRPTFTTRVLILRCEGISPRLEGEDAH